MIDSLSAVLVAALSKGAKPTPPVGEMGNVS